MELDTDLSKIQSEELLRKMWQQSEDINRKKEIRSQLYKLRESRLRDLYQFDIMADNNVAGFGKDPLAPSHGESFGDQSFQSLKSKEIRDSMSPSELKFQSMALNNPSSTGWNVQSSSEVTPDGRGFRAETIATTDGVEHINGGTAEFKGRNEQRSMAMQEGDDKNFVKKASESSNTHLQEKVVIGDENSGRTEIRTSSSTSTSSSKVFQSSSTTEYENDHPVDYHQPKYLMDSAPQRMQEPQQYQQRPSQAEPRYEPRYEPQYYDDHQQQQYTNQQTEQYQRNRQETNTSQNVQTNETREQNKRYVDMDKASPEYQQHVQYLMSQPGEIISNTVEYPKPNVKMITTVKRLPDGTIVRNKRYETEETTPTPAPSQTNTTTRQTVTNTNNTQRRDSQPTYQQPKNYQGQPPSERLRRPSDDVVDNAETVRRHTTTNDDTVETKYSTTKTSNRKFSTETTSETIHEYDDGYQVPSGGPRPKPVTNDFSTHGFPSVRPNKPTQEFANHRPQAMHPSQASPSQKMTSPPPREALIPVRSEYEPTVTERRIPTEDGEVIVVSSEKKRSVKHHTNSERIIETDIRTTDDNRYEQISDVSTSKTNQDFSTHGFPSVREPQQGQPPSRTSPDYSTQGFPSVRGPQSQPNAHPDYRPQPSGPMQPTGSVTKTIQTPDGEVIVTSQKSHTTKYNTNSERIIETEVLGDDGRPVRRIPVDVEYVSDKYTVTTPGDQVPQKGFPSVRSPTKPVADYSTPHGFPSTRYSHQKPSTPDYSTQGFPSTRDTHKPSTPDYSTQGFPSTRDGPQPSSTPERQYVSPVKTPTSSSKPSPTVEATERIIRKEKEVDSAHRAFAASLRSSSPVDQTRRDSYSTDGPRHTPRSSVSSTKPFRRDMREGSHDSETSRISTTTVTRQTPPRSVGGKTVVVTERVTSSSSPRGTKSPSPGKNVTTTTTTTTRTVTNKAPVKDVPKSEPSPRSSPAPSSRSSPYPSSKSKTPLGEDDQKPPKSHTSRPFMPTSSPSSRSPQTDHDRSPIGYQDVRNSRDQQHPHPDRPRPHDNDEPKAVTREDTFEQVDIDRDTSTVVAVSQRKPSRDTPTRHQPDDEVFISEEDHVYEDIDSAVTRNVKTTTKQLITHEKQPGRTPQSGVRPVGETKRPARRNEPEKTTPLAPKSQQSPRTTPSTPTQSPRKSLSTSQPSKTPSPTKPSDKAPKQPGSSKQPSGDTRKPSKPEILKQTEVIKSKTTKYTEDYRQQSPEPKKKPEPRPSGKSPQEIKKHDEPKPNSKSPGRVYPLEDANEPKYTSPDYEYPSEDEEQQRKPSSKSPAREYPQSRPVGKSPQREDKPRNEYPGGRYPPGDQTNPKQQEQPGKPISKSPERRYPAEKPQSRPDDKSSKPGYQQPLQKPGKPEHPYDTEEEVERVTSEFTIKTTNKNLKTRQDIEFVIEDKPQSRPVGKSPQREYPDEKSPSGDATKPQQQKPGKPISKSPERRYADDKPKSRPDDKNSKPGHKQPSQESGKPGHPYDTDEERVTSEFTIITTNKNVRTHQDIEFVDEDKPQSRPTSKSPQRKYPHEDKPRNEYPDERYPSEDKTKPLQKQPGKPSHADDKTKSRPDDKSSKPGHKQPSQEHGKPGHPYDTDEERVTSEFTIITTNKNVKTRQDIEFTNEDKPQSRPSSKSPHREYSVSPDRQYPSGDRTKPKQQPGKPSDRSPQRTYPNEKPDDKSPTPDYPGDGSFKQPSQKPGKPQHPYDTEEEVERVTSEFTVKTTNQNVKTLEDIEFVVESKPHSRPSSKSPQRESPDRPYPSDDKTKPMTSGKPSDKSPQRTYPYDKPQSTPSGKSPKSGKPRPWEDAPLEPEHPYDVDEEERITMEMTIKTTNKNVKTRQDFDIHDENEEQLILTGKRPQKRYPYGDSDKPREESPNREYPLRDKVKPGEPSRKSPKRTHPHDELQFEQSDKSLKPDYPKKTQPGDKSPLEPEYPSDTEEEERHTSEVTVTKTSKTRKDIDILVEDETTLRTRKQTKEPKGQQPDTEEEDDEEPKFNDKKPTSRTPQSAKTKYPEQPDEPTSKTPKSTRPSLYETTAEKYIRNDDITTVTQKNVTTTIHDKFMDAERKYPTEEPQKPEDTKEPKAPRSETESTEPKKPLLNKDDKDFPSKSPEYPAEKKPTPKSTRPSLYETTAEKYIRNDDNRNVTQKTTTTTIHEQFIEAEQSPRKPKDFEPKASEPFSKAPQQPKDNDKEPKAKDSPQGKPEPEDQKPKVFEAKLADYPDRPQESYPKDKEPSSHYPEQPDDSKTVGYPGDKKPFSKLPKEAEPKDNEPIRKPTTKTTQTTTHEKFIEPQTTPAERPDGAFISKAPEEPAQYPSYIKKGTTRRDTFEDRCRQILGMESYGDTPGAYKKRPSKDVELEEEEDDKVTQKETVQKTTFEVKIEDCDDEDDEPLSINSVKKTLVTKKVPETKPQTKPRDMKPYEDDKPETTSESEPEVTYPDDEETLEVTTTETEFIDVTKKSPTETKKHPKGPKEYTTTTEEIYVTEVKKHQPDTTSDSEPETRETFKETIDVTKKRSEKTQVDVGKEPTSRSPTRPKSPTYDTRKPSSRSPQRYPEDITYQTEELTKESHIDIKKKVTSQSPTRPKSPTHETKKPSGRSPQRTPKDNSYEQVVVTTETTTRKPTSRSPMRTVSPTDEQKKPRSPSTSPQRRPKGPTYETTEVINERTETSRKPGSKSPTRPTYGEKKPSSTSPQRTPSSTSPQRTPKIYTSETEEVIIETTTRKSGSPVRPVSPFSKKPTSRSPTTSPQRTTKGSTYETVEVDKEITKKPSSRPKSPTYDTHKKPTSESPSRGPKSAALKPSKSPERPILTEDSEYESVIVTKQTDISKKTTSRSPTRVSELTPETPKKPSSRPKSPTYETQKKPISQSPTRGPKAAPHKPSKSPERATLTEDSQYETVVVSKQTDITKKTTSRSPTRMAEPKPSTVDSRKKPTSQSPSRGPKTTPSKTSKSPDRATLTEDSEYETVVVTEQTDVTKRVTSKSPTRFTEPRPERQPSKPTDTFTRPTAKKPQVKTNVNEEFITSEKVLVTKVKKDYPETTSESEPERPQPHEVSTKTIEITKKRNESSPTRRPEGSSPVYGSPKDRSYETIEVTNKRIETTKKPSSKSPTRPITDREPSSRVTKKTSTPTKPIAKPTMESPKQGPKTKPRGPTKSNITEEFITTEKVYVTGIEKDYPETTSDSEMEPQETYVETIEVTNKKKADKNIEITKKSVNKTPTKPSSEAPKKTPVKSTPSKDTKVVTETIKDRLRSSVRKDKPSPKKPDQVDAVSSPETSPNRLTERRRSSNISVNTEIIIEHTEHTAETATTKKTKDSVYKEIIDSTTLPEKLTRKMPVTERKESAPVHRVTRKDKDTKMSRSTSENLIKVQKKPEDDKPRILTPTADKKPTPKPTADHRRPNKCFATKTINLSATDRLMSSEDMENVIIDIQHAKSSREPSPDKIVPTPVPAHLDTGKPRYPDVVQEPEDEPKRKPVIKNIPIFEEENNSYVGCHISEASHRTFEDDDDSLCTPLVEAPSSLDYPSISETSYPTTTVVTDDECLLSVHDKVSRFQNIAEEVKKPKTSSPFHREFDDKTRVPDNDECLLSVDEKVDKFIKSAESLTTKQTTITTARDSKPKEFPGFNDDEDDLEVTECPFTTVKLAPSEPQKSPELVRHISRHISRQSDLGEPATEQQHTHRNETTMHEEFLSSQTTAEEFVTHRRDQTTSAVKQQPRRPVDRHDDDRDDEVYDEVHVNGDDDDEELIPHTAMHTVRLEERRQKDILARPSVFDNSKPRGGSTKPTPTPTKPTTATTPSTASRINKTQPRYVSPATKDSEKSRQSTPQQQRPQVKPKQSPKVTATATTTITSHTTTTTSAANKRQPHTQSPQQRRTHPDSDSDYRVGSHNKNETPVKSSTTIGKQKPKQQPVYGSINGPKKSPHSPQPVVGISVTVKKSPMHTAEQQRRSTTTTTNTSKNVKRSHVEVDEYEHEHDDDSDNVDYVEEFQVVEEVVPNDDSETELIINSDTTVRSTNSHQTKEETVKTKRATANNVRREPSTASPTSKSPATRPKMKETTPGSPLSTPSRSTKDHHSVDLTEKSTLHKHSTTNKSPSTTTTTTEPNESFLENRPPIKKTPGQTPYRPKTMITPTESVAARRSLFENHNNQATKPLARRPTPTSTSSSPSSGRRPSYMDHTKSSLEHIRRDSLEINKTNYTRRPSANDDDAPDRNSQVKFDVPQKPRSDVLDTDDSEYNIEEIFDLVILEKLLETVTSYEVRRRIRAQIRLVKKNMSNAEYTTVTTTSKRDNKTKPTSAQVISKKEEKQQQHYYYKEEHQRKERHSSTHTSPERVRTTQVTKVTTRRTESPDSKYSSPSEGRSVSPQSRLSQTRVCSRTHERSPSPSSVATEIKVKEVKKKQYENVEHVEEIYRESSPKIRKPKAYYPIDDDEEEVDTLSRPVKKTDVSEEYDSAELHEERTFKKETTHRRSSRKSISPQSSPERQKASSPRAGSPEGKKPLTSRVSPKSPERKTIITEQQQQQTLMTTKQQPKRTPVSAPLKSKPEPKAPVWADRKNILKSPSATPKKPSAVAPDSRISSSVSRTMKSSTQQQKVSSSTKSSYVEDDCITSSYGIGPTDENGLPLFGIRALKMKKPQQQQQPASEPICETTEEVTGYVVEEKYYSDNKSKPIVERKEIIYSTNPEELQAIKEKVRETATTTTTLKSLKHDKLESDDESPFRDNSTYKTKTITSVRSSPEEFLESSTTKYVRRGSVKEMSEKFLQKESASMVSEKTNNYPKAGLILRTNSRKQSRDNDDMDGENNEYYESRTSYRDTDEEDECRMVAGGEREYIVESESETESIKNTQREFKKITSTKSSSSSRSFLNTKGEEKIITGVDDVLDRMRNADNVVEEGDTAEDQEARALLNKFLGASIIMKGVESTIPTIPTVNRETKIITTTTTGVGSGRQPAKHEVKTTRVTKSIKSGSSSSPVIETTCDIEEIWDEEILKQLLEQAKTYEERRKIRSRLRELMADRAEKNSCQQTGKEEGESAAVAVVAAGKRVEELKSPVQRSESSASSEYEIIEEEVTCTESESEEVKETAETTAPQKEEELKQSSQEEEKEDTTSAPPDVVPTEPPSTEEQSQKQEEQQEKEEEKTVEETKESDTTDSAKETTDSCAEKGESPAMPTQQGSMHQQQNKMMQVHQANNHKLASQHSSSPAASSKLSSDRSQMHAPSNNKQSSSAYLANGQYAKNPTVTVTAGNTTVRDLGSSSSLGALGSSNNNNSGSSSSISSSQRQVDRLGVPQKEDSGTESGEDLRFIAAGLRDQLQMKSDSNIIDDVTCALSRLEASLKEGKDISVDTEKRKALLALVGRLQAGLTSPEKLAEIAAAMSELDGNDPIYGETSSPEADAHRSNRQRFAKRRNRIDRHTVGVSREELADARRYMEDMLIMENICQATTPEAANSNSPPQWFPLEKNASTGSILMHNNSGSSLAMRQNNFLNENYVQSAATNNSLLPNPQSAGKRRPVSGDFSVSFGLPSTTYQDNSNTAQMQTSYVEERNAENASSDSNSKFARFTNKKQLMKRANTIDIAKTKRFNSDLDTDSDAEDRSQTIGLKRTVHPTVKKRVSNVVPPFEPKTENDRKFLAFINKQSDKPGLGWTNSRSVSNWTTKFGSLKHTFEAGGSGTVTAAKPPQIPSHIHPRPAVQQQQHHVPKQPQAPVQNYMSTNQQIAQRLQQEAQRQAEERRIKLEYERMEAERREREKLELLRQQQQRERMERERLEREYYEREIRERNQRAAQQSASVNVPKPIPINEFKHAPQSVFRPIDNGDSQQRGIYKPIPQLPAGPHSWQAPLSAAPNSRSHEPLSPSSYAPHTRPDNSFITTPPPSSKSPIGLPWASKPTVDSSSFKSKANKFEERSKYDNYNNGAMLQRHHSLRSSNMNVMPNDDFKKRPSLPNTSDPFGVQRNFHSDYPANPPLSYATTNPPLSYGGSAVPEPPPPTNISFVYNNHTSKPTYLSYPCLPTAVMESGNYARSREDSLTNPQAVPLVLTSANPSYCPPQQPQPAAREYMSSSTLDVMSPPNSTLTSPSIPAMQQQPLTDYTDDDLESENLTEYRAVSKVMAKPQSQTAVTVGRRTGHVSDDEVYGKNSKAAKSLLSTMKSIGSKTNGESKQRPPVLQTTKRPEPVTSPQTCLSPDGRAYQAPMVDPIFPDLTNFEPNRKPLYEGSTKKPQATPTPYGQPRNQPTMYKSLENIAKRVPPPQQSPVANQNHAPTYVPRQCPSPTPYVSETQTSYVVTYPIDDTTDDEDQSRYSSYSRSSDAVPMRRSRNTSETSTLSSTTTAPMVYSNHVPSPNTSWTTNPINEPTIVATSGQSFYEPAQVQGYATSQSNAPTTLSKASPSYQTPKMSTQYQPSSPAAYTNSMPAPYPATTTTTQYQSTSQVSQPSPTKTNYTSPPQYPTSYPSSQQTNHYEVSQPQIQQQLPAQVPTNQTKTPVMQTSQPVVAPQKTSSATPAKSKKTVTSSASKQTQEKVSIKTSLANMRKSVSEDYQDVKSVTTATRKSSISKDTASNKVEQKKIESQTATTDVRRKSLGSTVEYQKTEERHTTAMATKQTVQPEQQIYKSSAPPDTPDIVKSSLPKDENQPILKKFGPPQRHHYTPNSYQSPLGKGDTTTATTASKTEHHAKSVKVTATKSILKTSATTKAPTVIEKPASPEPEEEYIPRNIVYNNIHAFTAMSARRPDENRSHFEPVIRPNKLSKSDSWNQIVNLQNQASAQKFVPSPTNELRRTKSGHTLSIPKMYEAGLDKTEVTEKQRTVAAYFSGQKSPVHHEQTVVEQTKKSTINRTKTSEKISASRKSMGSHHTVSQGGGLTRSATMPHIANLRLLDESNVEDAFEQLMMDAKPQQSCTSTTEKTETKGKDGAVVTTTTKVTTRTVSGTGPKPVSPFAKFKQLDRQNSQQSTKSPTTPTTPGGGPAASPSATGNAPIFRFTDPSLNARAATAKEQLLQWCQLKTKEYENVQITNFSSSWVDGLAFCALIHHFLPDAFDYSKLTPQNRRENFELAFTVADEKAGIAPLLDVEDMVVMKRPDWKCVFVYVQSIYRRFRNCQ